MHFKYHQKALGWSWTQWETISSCRTFENVRFPKKLQAAGRKLQGPMEPSTATHCEDSSKSFRKPQMTQTSLSQGSPSTLQVPIKTHCGYPTNTLRVVHKHPVGSFQTRVPQKRSGPSQCYFTNTLRVTSNMPRLASALGLSRASSCLG